MASYYEELQFSTKGENDMKDITEYYHCTTSENLKKIIESGYIKASYFDGVGVYLAENPYECQYFGDKMIVIDSIYLDNENLSTDDVNDGIFHKGSIPFFDFDVYDSEQSVKFYRLSELEENEGY